MDLFVFFKVLFICLLGAMSPGPSWALVINNSILKGKLNGIVTSIGHGIGITIYALMANTGIVILLNLNVFVFNLIQFLAIIFLLYLGYVTLFSNFSWNEKNIYLSESAFFQGFLMAILNPKILIWFTAIYSQFISTSNSFIFNSILVATAGIVDTSWYVFLVVLVTYNPIYSVLKKRGHMISRLTGALFIFISLVFFFKFII